MFSISIQDEKGRISIIVNMLYIVYIVLIYGLNSIPDIDKLCKLMKYIIIIL